MHLWFKTKNSEIGLQMSEKITFTLDGKEVKAEPGETIWEVANGRGIKIPHLCHSGEKGYRPDGNCRACMVRLKVSGRWPHPVSERLLKEWLSHPTIRAQNKPEKW